MDQAYGTIGGMDPRSTARAHVLEHFRWIDGDADTWSMLRDADGLRIISDGLVELLRPERIDVIVGIEARGFVLAPLVARQLGVGFSPIRKGGALFPGETIDLQTGPDYRRAQQRLALRTDHFDEGQRVALVDDWIETGSQAAAAAQLISSAGARLVAIAVLIDEASAEARASLPKIHALVAGDDLP